MAGGHWALSDGRAEDDRMHGWWELGRSVPHLPCRDVVHLEPRAIEMWRRENDESIAILQNNRRGARRDIRCHFTK